MLVLNQNGRSDARSSIFSYGFLGVFILLVGFTVHRAFGLPDDYPYDRYQNVMIPIMLLLNHLAFQFQWPRPFATILSCVAIGWIGFAMVYIFYLSDRMNP